MKNISILICLFLLALSCNNDSSKNNLKAENKDNSFQILNFSGIDTVNLIVKGVKQGKWIISKIAVVHHTIYSQSGSDTAIVKSITTSSERVNTEEGFYKDNKKEGLWKYFSPNGKLKNSIEFKGDIAIVR